MKKIEWRNWLNILLVTMAFSPVAVQSVNAAAVTFPRGKDRDMEKASLRLFKDAIDQYRNKEYWKAARDLVIILDFYSQFSQIDGVVFYIGECLYSMNMYRSAERMYQFLVENYGGSDFTPRAYLGLQKIQYNAGNYEKSIQFYNRIVENYGGSKARDGAQYYCGMAYYHLQEFDPAIAAFDEIKHTSDFYDYGLYTSALSYLKKKEMEKAVEIFRAVLALPIINQERQDLIRTTHLTLGYLYYELGYYREAIKHYAKIPVHDETYPEALLASAWASIKLGDYQHAIISLNELVKRTDDPKYNEEAHFLLGQCYTELEFYDFTIHEYNYIIERYPRKDNIEKRIEQVKEGLAEQQKMAEALRVRLIILEGDLMHVMPLDEHNEVPLYLKHEQDRVEKTQDNLMQRLLDERLVFDEFQSNLLQLREDIFIKQSRRHWRAYSEYGKAREYFLKTIP